MIHAGSMHYLLLCRYELGYGRSETHKHLPRVHQKCNKSSSLSGQPRGFTWMGFSSEACLSRRLPSTLRMVPAWPPITSMVPPSFLGQSTGIFLASGAPEGAIFPAVSRVLSGFLSHQGSISQIGVRRQGEARLHSSTISLRAGLEGNTQNISLGSLNTQKCDPKNHHELSVKTGITHQDRNGPKVLQSNRLSRALMLIFEAQSWFSDKG